MINVFSGIGSCMFDQRNGLSEYFVTEITDK